MLTPTGEFLTPERFNAATPYGGHVFQMSHDNTKPARKAFEAFTENRAHRFPNVADIMFDPSLPFGEIRNDKVNTYRKPPTPRAGDIGPFLTHLAKIIPIESDRQILLQWMAHVVQRPDLMTRWAPVLVGASGNGKTIFGECVARAIGTDYREKVRPGNISTGFNGWMRDKLFMQVDEINMAGNRDMLDDIKPWITDSPVTITAKGVEAKTVPNFTNWFFCTNRPNGVIKERGDRRFAIFYCAQEPNNEDACERDGITGEYIRNLVAWLENGGYEHVAAWLMTLAVGEFPVRAPRTSSTDEAMEATLGPVASTILEAINEGEQGFKGGWLSSTAIKALLERRRVHVGRQNAIREACAEIGYHYAGQANRTVTAIGGGTPILYTNTADRPATSRARVNPGQWESANGYPAPGSAPCPPPVVVPFHR